MTSMKKAIESLSEQINNAQRLVKTDAYQMSLGELVSMYEQKEIVIQPDFQRLFRWDISQKSRLIESVLLGIPLPSIFVFEKEDGSWELIDGLQRLSTILEFMGLLKTPDGIARQPSALEATKYLPSLHNVVWQKSDAISDPPPKDQVPLDKGHQLAIRRARVGVEILKRPSENKTKFDLFQRLNAGGTQANAQELRNCIMLMVSEKGFNRIKKAAERASFKEVIGISEEQVEKQRHLEFAVRFLVHTNIEYDGILDIEEHIDDGIVNLLESSKIPSVVRSFEETFDLLHEATGTNALRKIDNNKHVGKVGLVGLEVIAVGVARNLISIKKLADPASFVERKIRDFWKQREIATFTSPGLRGTIRLQRTIPFGVKWFKP